MKTGLKELDSVLGSLVPSGLIGFVGRPCNGKTSLLIDIAIRIHRRYQTNVVFATASELPEAIVAKAPGSGRRYFTILPAIEVLRQRGEIPIGRKPRIYVVDTQAVGPRLPHYISHRLSAEHSSRCGLLVSDGWTVYPDRVTYIERELGGICYELNIERPAQVLPASALVDAKRFASGSGIVSMYGIRTADPNRSGGEPRLKDLLQLRSVVRQCATRTVLVHRPELYPPRGNRRQVVDGSIEIATEEKGQYGARRAKLKSYIAIRKRRGSKR